MDTDLCPLWVLTCAPLDRQDEAERVLSIVGDPDKRVLVTTQPRPITDSRIAHLVLFDSDEINISKWWTMGLDFIAEHADLGPYDVLIIESDGMMTRRHVDTVRRVMREEDCDLAGADWAGVTRGEHVVRRDNSMWINDVDHRADNSRLPGMAMVLRGESGLRHDPEFRWWLADDDLEWTARAARGTVLVAGTTFAHTGTQGPLTGDRLKAWHEDAQKFLYKWGGMPANGGI